MLQRWWRTRWIQAVVVAAAIAAWPACSRNTEAPDAHAGGEAGTLDLNLDFTLKNLEGVDVRLADYKGKPLLINFWATWCGPCKAEVPWFVECAEKYQDQGFTVVGISVDDTPEDIRAFNLAYKVNYPMLVGRDREDVAKAFGAQMVIPVSWLIRADGTAHSKVTGIHGKDWFEQQIQELF